MTTRVNGAVKQGFWFTKQDICVFSVDVWDEREWDADGGFQPSTYVGRVIQGLQTMGTVLWWDVNNTGYVTVILEGAGLEVDANGSLTADAKLRIKTILQITDSREVPGFPVVSGGVGTGAWVAKIRTGAPFLSQYGNGIINEVS